MNDSLGNGLQWPIRVKKESVSTHQDDKQQEYENENPAGMKRLKCKSDR